MIINNIQKRILKDFKKFIAFSKSHKNIVDATTNEATFKDLYTISYLLYNILDIDVEKLNCSSNELKRYRSYSQELKQNLLNSIDLVNFKHFTSAQKEYRSLIESAFRLLLFCTKVSIYNKRKEDHIFSVNQSLADIQSKMDTHKIGSFTNFMVTFFKGWPIADNIIHLNKLYSTYSSVLHTNTVHKDNMSTTLQDITNPSTSETKSELIKIIQLLIEIVIIVTFGLHIVLQADVFGQQDFYLLINTAKKYKKMQVENKLKDITKFMLPQKVYD